MATHIEAEFVFSGETVFEVDLPAEGKLSASIAELRKQSGAFLTTFLATHNQSTDEVDVMEEAVDAEGVVIESGKDSGKQRKQKRKR